MRGVAEALGPKQPLSCEGLADAVSQEQRPPPCDGLPLHTRQGLVEPWSCSCFLTTAEVDGRHVARKLRRIAGKVRGSSSHSWVNACRTLGRGG